MSEDDLSSLASFKQMVQKDDRQGQREVSVLRMQAPQLTAIQLTTAFTFF